MSSLDQCRHIGAVNIQVLGAQVSRSRALAHGLSRCAELHEMQKTCFRPGGRKQQLLLELVGGHIPKPPQFVIWALTTSDDIKAKLIDPQRAHGTHVCNPDGNPGDI